MSEGAFHDAERADRAFDRLSKIVGANAPAAIGKLVESAPDPDLALLNLERWLTATGNPSTHFANLVASGDLGGLLINLLGSSKQLTDVLTQNPEFGSLILDPELILQRPRGSEIENEGRRLLASAHTYSFKLDRLRFLKQRHMLSIAVADLGRLWPEEEVWNALSVVAIQIIDLCREVVWREMSQSEAKPSLCPVDIVAFGKLGGFELNYSSDVDLAYVLSSDADPSMALKFAERFGRAMTERMGRGALYRVDLRLRPFGKSGPLLNTMEAIEAYYERYAEPWEHMALIRSTVIIGDEALAKRWETMRQSVCFKPSRGEWAIDQILDDRSRTAQSARLDDLKRGPGGIRDVEFFAQLLQLLHGHCSSALQVKSTCSALMALESEHIVRPEVSRSLVESYTFLRQLEHRCQLIGDQQTHTLPSGQIERTFLARTMGLPEAQALLIRLEEIRDLVWTAFEARFRKPDDATLTISSRAEVLANSLAPQLLAQWFDSLPESEAYYRWIHDDELSAARAEVIALSAPVLIRELQNRPTLSEVILAGEWQELHSVPLGDVKALAKWHRSESTLACARWVIDQEPGIGESLSEISAEAIRSLLSPRADLVAIALGSFAASEMGVHSDADLLLAVAERSDHALAEQSAQSLLSDAQTMRNEGAAFEVDLRLRPEGRKGLLVVTLEGLRHYAQNTMETWERFALARCRPLSEPLFWSQALHELVYFNPFGAKEFQELQDMKSRIEAERGTPSNRVRNIKLGPGGLDDIDWLVQIAMLCSPPSEPVSARLRDRLDYLIKVQAMEPAESDLLYSANLHLRKVRDFISLLGFEDDLISESPDQLDALATAMGEPDRDSFLNRDRSIREAVRSAYAKGMERLAP